MLRVREHMKKVSGLCGSLPSSPSPVPALHEHACGGCVNHFSVALCRCWSPQPRQPQVPVHQRRGREYERPSEDTRQWTPSLAGQQPSAALLHLTTSVYRLSACTTIHMVVLVHVLIKYTSQHALIKYYYYYFKCTMCNSTLGCTHPMQH